jgi:sugar phosphate isomerase/epimerase
LNYSRRDLLKTGSAALIYGAAFSQSSKSYAETLKLPLGLQLYSVRQQLSQDFEGTLAQVASLGYREVEAAGFYGRSAVDVKRIMEKVKLRCVSAHYPFGELQPKFDEILDYLNKLGAEYVICASPGFKTPPAATAPGHRPALTLDDWRWNAEQFNRMGEKAASVGIRLGFHNHTDAFTVTDGILPYTEILRLTDPAKVTLELDCGWAVVAGANPVELFRDHPDRFSMLHVKDFKLNSNRVLGGPEPKVTELGLGSIDYRPIFEQAAKTQKIKHIFVEQEEFDMPYMQSLKMDADYIHRIEK